MGILYALRRMSGLYYTDMCLDEALQSLVKEEAGAGFSYDSLDPWGMTFHNADSVH